MAITDHQRVEWSSALCSNLEQLLDLHSIIGERLAKMKKLAATLEKANRIVKKERSEEGSAMTSLSDASEDAVRRARLIGVKLEAVFLEQRIDEDTYRAALSAAFPRGPQSMGPSPADRKDALLRIVAAFQGTPDGDPDGDFTQLAADGARAIDAANESAKREQADSQAATETLGGARHRFDEGYQATKEIVSGLLRDAGRLGDLRDVFPDM